MKLRLSLHVITMNRDELLSQQLTIVRPYVDAIRICDGAGSKATKSICKRFKARYYHRQWDDDFAAQDNLLFSKAKKSEWILVMDSDEIPSKELLQNLRQLATRGEAEGYNCVRIPAISILDGVMECNVSDRITAVQDGRDIFRKDWFFKFAKGIYSTGSPHRGFHHPDGWTYHDTGYSYYHIKTTDDFIFNDCIHAFINPEGQGYSYEEADELKSCECIKLLRLSTDVIPMLEFDRVTPDFKEFMQKYKDEDRPISRWYWAYYFIFNQEDAPLDNAYHNYLQHKQGYKSYG